MIKTISKKAWAISKDDLILHKDKIKIVSNCFYSYSDYVIEFGKPLVLEKDQYVTLVLEYKKDYNTVKR